RLGVPLQKIPDNITRRRPLKPGLSLLLFPIILRGIIPKRRGLNPQRRFFEFHGPTTISEFARRANRAVESRRAGTSSRFVGTQQLGSKKEKSGFEPWNYLFGISDFYLRAFSFL